jgi:para-nitrobenzyl esterase
MMLWLALVVGGVVVGGGGALTTTSTGSSPLPPTNGHSLSGASSGLVVRTAQGLARGLTSRGSRQWLGLPYAAPPTGHLRY